MRDVRDLPKVLRNDEASEKFIGGGLGSIEVAKKHLDKISWEASSKDSTKMTVNDAPTELLAQTLINRIIDMPFSTLQALKDDEKGVESVGIFEELADRLGELLAHVGK